MATYVLVHGAYQGGWIWKLIAERLRAAGHIVYAPTLDGCAERHHEIRAGITIATHAKLRRPTSSFTRISARWCWRAPAPAAW